MSFRIPILVLLPKLKRINKGVITVQERDEAYEVAEEKYAEIMDEESKHIKLIQSNSKLKKKYRKQ